LNLGGQPEGAAFDAETVLASIDRDIKRRAYQPGIHYHAFFDGAGGSGGDDACLAIGHTDQETKQAILDVLVNQGQKGKFDPIECVGRFAKILETYHVQNVTGDSYSGEILANEFQKRGIGYTKSQLTKHEIYASFEPRLNSGQVRLLNHAELESQLIGLVWKNNKIDHATGEHDDFSNAACGALMLCFNRFEGTIEAFESPHLRAVIDFFDGRDSNAPSGDGYRGTLSEAFDNKTGLFAPAHRRFDGKEVNHGRREQGSD